MEKIYRVQMNKHGMPNFATAQEVVRCKECKHKDEIVNYCYENDRNVNPDGFCSYGERSEQ